MKNKTSILTDLLIAIVSGLILALFSSCTKIDYNGFHYFSMGGKGFEKLTGVKDGNDIKVIVEGYKSEDAAGIAREAARGAVEGARGIAVH